MLRDRGSGDRGKPRRDLDDRQLPRADESQDLAAMRLRDRAQGDVRGQR